MTRILIVKMWALGDIMMATPMLNAIRAAEPGAHITWIVDSFHAEILAGHPLIDELIPLDSGAWRRLLRNAQLPAWIRRTRELNAQMAGRRFDIAINCQPEKWWTTFLCPAPVRIALFPSPTVPFSGCLYTRAIPKPKRAGLHNTDQFLQATAAAGFPQAGKQMSVGKTADETGFFDDFARGADIEPGRPFVVLAPFSTADNRSIPPAFAARIAAGLVDEYGARVVVTVGPGDTARLAAFTERAPQSGVTIAQGTTVRQFVALVRRATLVVTVDSSPMHLAAAVGTPYVALFGPTPVNERAPLAGNGVVLVKPLPCAPCDLPTCSNKIFQQCLTQIPLGDVEAAIRRLMPVKA